MVRNGVEQGGAGRAMQDEDAEGGGEAGGFGAPVWHKAGGADEEGGAVEPAGFLLDGEVGQGLDGFAKAHVVGQHAAEARVAQEGHPVHAVRLVWAKRGGEARRDDGLGDFAGALQLTAEVADGVAAAPDDAGVAGGGLGAGEVGGILPGQADGAVTGPALEQVEQGADNGADLREREGEDLAVGQAEDEGGFGFAFLRGGAQGLGAAVADEGEQGRHEVDVLAVDQDAQLELQPVDPAGAGGGGTEFGADRAFRHFDAVGEILGEMNVPAVALEDGQVGGDELQPAVGSVLVGHEEVGAVFGRDFATVEEAEFLQRGGFEAFGGGQLGLAGSGGGHQLAVVHEGGGAAFRRQDGRAVAEAQAGEGDERAAGFGDGALVGGGHVQHGVEREVGHQQLQAGLRGGGWRDAGRRRRRLEAWLGGGQWITWVAATDPAGMMDGPLRG